ncbi:MAG: UDP-3-O-(3-hydroxymyristoyl)glucosamine N-acyltransferase [Planctomycetota bacterium]
MWNKKASEIAELVDGELRGNPDIILSGVAGIEEAGGQDLAFLADQKYEDAAKESAAGAMLVERALEGWDGTQILCADPELAFARVLRSIRQDRFPVPEGISPEAVISAEAEVGEEVAVGPHSVIESGAEIGDGVKIYPLCYVGHEVKIGAGTILHPGAIISDGVRMGRECVVRPGAVVGDDGFGFIQRENESYRMQHVAGVEIGDCVEIGGLSSIDRGMIADTVIGDGVKMDKHCHVAHNCTVGDNAILAGYARMGGSCNVGAGAVLAADVRLSDHVDVGDGAVMAAGTGAPKDVEAGETVWGMPARPIHEQMKITALTGRLPELHRKIRELEKKVEELSDDE